ncbi:MAG: sugar phosphate nucleotidyltransferase [bacterium]|nr:sugar phosphate nucleotidyltransferase [bacterium]
MYAVIMAGGQGTRLWPLSRQKRPKQLHSLVGEKSLIVETFERISLTLDPKNIFISTTPEYLIEIKKHLPEVSADNFITEPYPMGTAAACGLVSKIISLRDSNAIVALIASDAYVKNKKRFAEVLKYAGEVCATNPNHIITIGIKPDRPEVGYGYIHLGKKHGSKSDMSAYEVERFVEKPDLETAEKYLKSGEYLWNTSMFIWKTSLILDLIEKDLPKTSKALDKIAGEYGKAGYAKALEKHYRETDDTSIDYGIMEKNKNILVVPGDFGWSDVGTWNTILEVLSEINGVDVVSRGHHISVNDSNILVMAGEKLIATVGLKDVVVIDTPDALLICKSSQAHRVKEVISRLKDENKHQYL